MKTKNYFFLSIGLFISHFSFSQVSEYGVALGPKTNLSISTLPEVNMPQLNNDSLREFSDSAEFGKEYVGIVIDEIHDFWEESQKDTIIEDSSTIYEIARLKVTSPNAVSLAVIFSEFHLVDDMKLYIYGTEEGYPQEIVGAYTKENNRLDQTLVSREIFGKEIIIEINRKISSEITSLGSLKIKSLLHYYKNSVHFGTSLPCHVNAICSPWYNTYCNEVRSVVKIQTIEEEGGVARASGALINNTEDNFDPLIITAFHVLEGATRFNEWTFYFNFQSNTCTPSVNGNDLMVVQGMTEVATDNHDLCPDMSLLRLLEPVPLQYNAFFSGWNRRAYSSLPEDDRAIGIHHPSGDVKKISEGYRVNPLLSTCIKTNWTTGYTEGGSSGSPLYVTSKEIIGVLSWGYRDEDQCEHDANFFYSSLKQSWPTMQPHLAPNSSEVLTWEGIDPISACQQVLNLNGRFFPGNDWQIKNEIKIQASQEITLAQNRPTTIEESPYFRHSFDADYIIQAGNKIQIFPGFSVNAPFRFSSGVYFNQFPTGKDNKVSFRISPCTPFIDDCGFNHQNSSVKPLSGSSTGIGSANSDIPRKQKYIIQAIPNPNNGLFEIKVSGNLELKQIIIFTSTGQVVWHTTNSIEIEKGLKIDLSKQTQGLYFLKAITSSGSMLSSQFVIE